MTLFEHMDDYKLVVQQRVIPGDGKTSMPTLELRMCLWCLNPAVAFEALRKETRSIICECFWFPVVL